MIRKFDSSINTEITEQLPFSYSSSLIYLDFAAYILDRNGENIIVVQDMYYPHEFPALFLPYNSENWKNCSVTFATEEDKKKLEAKGIKVVIEKSSGTEYYYDTKTLLEPDGSTARRIEQFKKEEHVVSNSYSGEKVKEFYSFWRSQKVRAADTFAESEAFFTFCLEHLDRYEVRQVYVEMDGRLVGFAWGVQHSSGNWVGLHLKVDYAIKGLSRFLHQERAKMFPETSQFTLGTGAHEEGIIQFKEELGPSFIKEYSYVLTG